MADKKKQKAFHIKYRPISFDEYIARESLWNMLKIDDRKEFEKIHTYLIHGTRGCGKTTLARLLAYHIIDPEIPNEQLDLVITEMNAASTTGVDDARNILRTAELAPIVGNKKVLIIDEFHRFTKQAQDAMLKLLEEPPSYFYVIMCTTSFVKVQPTIVSRSKEIKVAPLMSEQMDTLLSWVIKKENLAIDKEVYNNIIKVSHGIPREALILLDMVKGMDPKEAVEAITNKYDESSLFDLAKLICHDKRNFEKKWEIARKMLDYLKKTDENAEGCRIFMLSYLGNRMLEAENPSRYALMMEFFMETWMFDGLPRFIYAVYACLLK
jgi:DNA polymerase III subunit gamma/tau